MKQAKDLLAEHPLETCRSAVDFALEKAPETNFKMRHFGAILAYVPEAIAALEQTRARRQREEEERRRRQAEAEAFKRQPVNVEGLLKLKIGRFKLDHRREPTTAEIEDLRRSLASTEEATA